jgi:hypothetical protein
MVEQDCANFVAQLPGPDNLPADGHQGLRDTTARGVTLMTSPDCVCLTRIIAGEAERRPQFAAAPRGRLRRRLGQAQGLPDHLRRCRNLEAERHRARFPGHDPRGHGR